MRLGGLKCGGRNNDPDVYPPKAGLVKKFKHTTSWLKISVWWAQSQWRWYRKHMVCCHYDQYVWRNNPEALFSLLLKQHLWFENFETYDQACIICGNAGSWIPGTFFPRHFYTIYAIFTRFYAIFTRFYMIFAIFTLLFARHLKLLCRPGSSLDESECELDFFTNEWKVKFDKIPKLTFSPFGENHPYWSKKCINMGGFHQMVKMLTLVFCQS